MIASCGGPFATNRREYRMERGMLMAKEFSYGRGGN